SCRSRRVPCAGLSRRPVAPSVVRGSYAVVVGTLARSRCGAVQAAVLPLPPALRHEVRGVRGRLVAPQRAPVVRAHTLADGAAGALCVPALPLGGAARRGHASARRMRSAQRAHVATSSSTG